MITPFLWKGKEQCHFISYVAGRSDNSYPNNIFHDYSKALFPRENVLFLQDKDVAKNLILLLLEVLKYISSLQKHLKIFEFNRGICLIQ